MICTDDRPKHRKANTGHKRFCIYDAGQAPESDGTASGMLRAFFFRRVIKKYRTLRQARQALELEKRRSPERYKHCVVKELE